ncbi:MAG: class I SAM-dependent methyltransferase [bacterium]|nr:class I SAM-dependent methyltransferase [bacterium]
MDKETIKTYDQTAKQYDDETVDFWNKFPKTFLDKFASLAKEKVLNIGSGPGRDGLLLKERGLTVVCLDASEAMISLSRERGLESVLGDFNQLPFEDSSFDSVWAYTSLLHVPKEEASKSIVEIKRVLRSGGILGLGLIEGETEGYKESSDIEMPRWFSFYTKPEVEEFLRKYGFGVVYFEEYKIGTKNFLNFIAKKLV